MQVLKSIEKTTFNSKHRKENSFYKEIIVIDTNTLNPVIHCKFYGTGKMNYCCLWVTTQTESKEGSGKAGGYGYHRESAALSEAIKSAGYTLSECISGVGNSAEERALIAIASFHGINNTRFYYANS